MGAAVFLASLLVRLANVAEANPGGIPRIAPFDDLYHAFRMEQPLSRQGWVSGFDPDRGPRGAFCPWPALYDTASGTAARVLGAREAQGMLTRVIWFPPVAASLFAAATALLLARRLDPWSGLLGGLAAALAPAFVEASLVGAIDHHFLEPALCAAIVAATVALGRAGPMPVRLLRACLLAGVLSIALFVQPALLLAAGAAAVVILIFGSAAERAAGAFAFSLATLAVLLYRLAQPAAYPEGSWYLGLPHAACLAGAAVACGAAALLTRRGVGRGPAVAAGIAFATLTVAAFPGAFSILDGVRFLRGDPWLDTIVEFQPLFYRGWPGVPEGLAAVGGGALLLVAATPGLLAGGPARRCLAIFALFYLAATVTTQRFLLPATILFAACGAVALSDLRRRSARAASLAGLVLVGPALAATIPLLVQPPEPIPARAVPILRAAQALRAAGAGGRVLSSWSWGHVFHVAGGRPVIVDNFGASIGQTDFQNALGIFFSPREDAVATYCRQTGIRFLVLENPLVHLTVQAQAIGLPASLYVKTDPAGPPRVTPRMRFSFWWRAYFDRGAGVSEPRRRSPPFRHFRLIYEDPGPASGPGRFRGPAVEVWELSDARDQPPSPGLPAAPL